MIYVYAAVMLLIVITAVVSHGYKREIFAKCDTREDPLKFLYPVAARVSDALRIFNPDKKKTKLLIFLKQLHVSENVSEQVYLFRVRRTAMGIIFVFAACMLGVLLSIKNPGNSAVTSLERNEYGEGSRSYLLEADIDGENEQIELEIEERKLSDEEIYQMFEEAFAPVRAAALGDNESWENVSSPLNLITEYGNIHISWDIDDPDLISYSGELTDELNEGESILVNLKATFSLENVSAVYLFPANLTAASLTKRQALVKAIADSISHSSSEYEGTVELPKEVNGKKITFTAPKDSAYLIVPALVVLAGAVVFFGYERRLQEQLKKRREQMISDFTEIVFKLSLLFEAGMSIRSAWERIIADAAAAGLLKDHFAFQEMKLASEKIKSGVSEAAAYGEFGKRCGLHQYIKLGNILQQNLVRGTKGMKELLSMEAQDAFEERKRNARKKGEEAGTKMLVPMVMMLLVVIVIVAVPALLSIGF